MSRVPKWTDRLVTGSGGKRAPVVRNALIALRECAEWRGVLGFNESTLAVMARTLPPWVPEKRAVPFPWADEDDTRLASWLQQYEILASPLTAGQAVQTVAREHGYHPIRDFLNAREWDGEQRIDSWLTDYLGAESSEYVAAIGARWLIGAVARIYRPGCKNDSCLILEGEQGTLKSTALRTLSDPWFSDDLAELGSKDSQVQLRGVWVFELAELDSMARGEVSRIKAFMSRATDRFRPPYGHRLVDAPRECVFAGTTNNSAYLRDESGARRFWPIRCGAINIGALKRDRDQLWAEAVARYRAGAPWWLDARGLVDIAGEEQQARYDGDPWDSIIGPWIAGRESVAIDEVLGVCIAKPCSLWTAGDKKRVAGSLRSMGWERFNSGPRGSRQWRYRPCSSAARTGTPTGTPEANGPHGS